MSKPFRLGVYFHGLLHSDGNRTFSNSPSFLFLKGLKEYGFHMSGICSSVEYLDSSVKTSALTVLEDKGIELFALPTWQRMAEQIWKLPYQAGSIKETLRRFVSSCDILWIRAPTAILGMILKESHRQHKPAVVHMAGNVRDGWRTTRHVGLTRIPAMLLGEVLHYRSYKLLKNETLLATGPRLLELFLRNGRRVISFVDNLVDLPSSPPRAYAQASRLLFVGRIDHGKGLFVILKTMRDLKNRGINLPLTVVGNGPLLDTLKKKCLKLGLSDIITWKGFVPAGEKLNAEYSKADALLIPSEATEGFPRVMLEAWANGVLVIGSRVGGLGLIIRHGENGLLVEPGDFKSLSEAILRLTAESALRKKLLEGGYSTLLPYTYERQLSAAAQALREAYNAI